MLHLLTRIRRLRFTMHGKVDATIVPLPSQCKGSRQAPELNLQSCQKRRGNGGANPSKLGAQLSVAALGVQQHMQNSKLPRRTLLRLRSTSSLPLILWTRGINDAGQVQTSSQNTTSFIGVDNARITLARPGMAPDVGWLVHKGETG